MNDGNTLQVISPDELRALLEDDSSVAVSVYLPTNRAAVEPGQNSLHLKNLVSDAREILEQEVRRPEACRLIAPLDDLLGDNEFWLHQLEGLALFRTMKRFARYRLPYVVPERVVVGPACFVKPLFPALFPNEHFFVLALSQHAVRLLHCTRHGCEGIDLTPLGIPLSLEEALRYDDLQKPELQHHPTTGPGRVPVGQAAGDGRGGRQHGFHGHGESGEGVKTQIRRYLQAVDAGLAKLLGAQSAPLIVAGVDYMRSIYRDVSHYRTILDQGIDGSPDRLSDASLHARALPIIEEHGRRGIERALESYETRRARGLASDELATVLEAAHAGRVDTLFARNDIEVWGSFDVASQSVHVHERAARGDVDLVDLAARQTFLASGTVYVRDASDMAGGVPVAASFRY
jgi:hypothetical protein